MTSDGARGARGVDGVLGALDGRAVVVVGASSGIGAATAHAAAAAGARVGALARRADRLDGLVAALPGTGHAAATAAVTDPAGLAAEVDDVVARRAGPRGVRITTVSPGFVATDLVAEEKARDDDAGPDEVRARFAERMHDQGLAPEDVAAAVVHVLGLPPHVTVVEYAVSSVRQLGYR